MVTISVALQFGAVYFAHIQTIYQTIKAINPADTQCQLRSFHADQCQSVQFSQKNAGLAGEVMGETTWPVPHIANTAKVSVGVLWGGDHILSHFGLSLFWSLWL